MWKNSRVTDVLEWTLAFLIFFLNKLFHYYFIPENVRYEKSLASLLVTLLPDNPHKGSNTTIVSVWILMFLHPVDLNLIMVGYNLKGLAFII